MKDILGYLPQNETETSAIRQWMERYGDQLLTRMPEGHFTASGFIFNPDRTKTLMIDHNIYRSWAWTGGHADGERDFEAIAMREAQEETGICGLRRLGAGIASMEILPVWAHVRRGVQVPSHLHLNVSYLFEADDSLPLHVAQQENSAVGWIEVARLGDFVSEPPMLPVYRRLLERANNC